MSRSRSTLLATVLGFAFVVPAAPAAAAPPAKASKAKPRKASPRKKQAKVVVLGAKDITADPKPSTPPANPNPTGVVGQGGGPPPPTPGATGVKAPEGGDFSFTLSANSPYQAFAGRLSAHYPRDWNTSAHGTGEIWISNHRLPNETYIDVAIYVQPGYEYKVEQCTKSNGGQLLKAKVGGSSHTFDAGTQESTCDLTLLLQPEATGWTSIRLDLPEQDGGNAFALNRVQVRRQAQ